MNGAKLLGSAFKMKSLKSSTATKFSHCINYSVCRCSILKSECSLNNLNISSNLIQSEAITKTTMQTFTVKAEFPSIKPYSINIRC